MLKRPVYTFSPGPCIFPLEVLQETQEQIEKAGDSVLGLTARAATASELVRECKELFRMALRIPNNYTIILGCGGATGQFASIPFNLMDRLGDSASYIVNGTWSELAFQEALMMGKPHLANHQQPKPWTFAPNVDNTDLAPNSKYLYFCDNETVHGIEFQAPPNVYGVDLAVDMTSNFLTRAFDCSRYGLIYSGAQKNWGPPGLAVIIIRNDLLQKEGLPNKPLVLDFKRMLRENTEGTNVPLFALVASINTLKWIMRNGGVQEMDKLCRLRSQLIYDTIDGSGGFYVNKIHPKNRSRVNIVCQIRGNDEKLSAQFVKEAAQRGLIQLAGHKSLGGLRFSIYNGMPMDGVLRLRDFMLDFQTKSDNKARL